HARQSRPYRARGKAQLLHQRDETSRPDAAAEMQDVIPVEGEEHATGLQRAALMFGDRSWHQSLFRGPPCGRVCLVNTISLVCVLSMNCIICEERVQRPESPRRNWTEAS